jgi:hypothetical protein
MEDGRWEIGECKQDACATLWGVSEGEMLVGLWGVQAGGLQQLGKNGGWGWNLDVVLLGGGIVL